MKGNIFSPDTQALNLAVVISVQSYIDPLVHCDTAAVAFFCYLCTCMPLTDRQMLSSMCSRCSMRSMCSMRGGFISHSWGPLQKVCHDPVRMSGHNCLPGQQTVCFPGGRPHEQNEEVPRMDGSAGRTHTIRTAHTFSLTPQLLLLSADFAPHQPCMVVYFP